MNITKKKRDEQWAENFEWLVEYVRIHGRPPNYDAYYEGKNLGRWLYAQKQFRKKGMLAAEHEELLLTLGVDFKKTRKEMFDEKWQENYELLVEFVRESGIWPTQKVTYKGFRIGNWLSAQKHYYKKGTLSTEREAKLRELGAELSLKVKHND